MPFLRKTSDDREQRVKECCVILGANMGALAALHGFAVVRDAVRSTLDNERLWLGVEQFDKRQDEIVDFLEDIMCEDKPTRSDA